jgi:hypothetical protein
MRGVPILRSAPQPVFYEPANTKPFKGRGWFILLGT